MGVAGLVTAFGFSLSIVVNGLGDAYHAHEATCYVQAFLLQYFYLASYLWTACFAFHLYQIIVVRNEYPERLLWHYRVIGWGIPGATIAFLVLRQLTGHLGVGAADRRWCWISVHTVDDVATWQREGAWQQLLLFYVPIGVIFLFNAVMYRLILRFLAFDPMRDRLKRRIVFYLVVFFLCSIWGVINRIVQFVRHDHEPSSFLTLMECICDPLQPFLNAVVYGTNRSSLEAYKERCCTRWFYASLPSSDEEDDSTLDHASLLSHDDRDLEDDDVIPNGDDRAYLLLGTHEAADRQATARTRSRRHKSKGTRHGAMNEKVQNRHRVFNRERVPCPFLKGQGPQL
ncbi:hypothetical protein PINS_up004831 [Pythium insidiosum]|nr:hypothetical protein PINS_up004831 [Pythium insidiosum]